MHDVTDRRGYSGYTPSYRYQTDILRITIYSKRCFWVNKLMAKIIQINGYIIQINYKVALFMSENSQVSCLLSTYVT